MPRFHISCIIYISEPWHEISNNVVCATIKGSDQPAHMCRLIRAFASSSNILWLLIKLLTQHHLEFLSRKGGCTGSSESTLVKVTHCCKSRVTAHISCLCFTLTATFPNLILMLLLCNNSVKWIVTKLTL